jgi:hypothetical protein
VNIRPTKFRKRPVEIEAMRYDGTPATCRPIHDWLGLEHTGTDCDAGIYIDTLEGQMHVSVGDYVIRGVQGEFYPCKPDIFDATYERAEGGEAE